MSKLKIEALTLIFGKEKEEALSLLKQGKSKAEILKKTGCTVAVKNADFEIEQGEFFVIMGLSGSGKSSLLRCLNRLIEPTSGKVILNQVDITSLQDQQLQQVRRKEMAMVFQKFGLLPHRSVLENVAFGLELQGVAEQERLEKAQSVINLVGLHGYEQQHTASLSGGMQQRVGLARALANDPEILLMDEAFSALDPLIRTQMQDELIDLQQKMHKTIVFITHDLDEAIRVGDRIAIMKDGEVIQIGTPEDILTSPATAYVSSFVEKVDRKSIVTAASLMFEKPTVAIYKKDGVEGSLRKMRSSGLTSLPAVSADKHFLGFVYLKDILELKAQGHKTIEKAILRDLPVAYPESTVEQMLPFIAENGRAVPVVDKDSNKLLGIVAQTSLLIETTGACWQNVNGNMMDNLQKEIGESFFDAVRVVVEAVVNSVEWLLLLPPFYVLILLIAFLAWKRSGWGLTILTLAGLFLIWGMGYWTQTMATLALILSSAFIALLIGIPLGIWAAKNAFAGKLIRPVLDLMQTLPAFVYLIPAVLFFGLGKVPGAFATVIFSMPPAVRLTTLGLKQVPRDIVEATRSFGATSKQLLFKVELPLALPTILAGVNQTMMMALSMVVISAMIAAGGLGEVVLKGITQLKIGTGFEGGIAVVILAVILDRITQSFGLKKELKV
eukprot:gene11112-12947_t